ncbi:MAG: GlsB/YeaQ/YmgE family stress response membrane protein [Heteroscytonema crispum UTEX LB 1556]
MNLIAWIILGIIAGAIAKAIYPGRQGGGILSTMILGVIGAFVGGSIVTLLNTGTIQLTAATLSIPGLIVAILGAMIAIFLWTLMTGRSAT